MGWGSFERLNPHLRFDVWYMSSDWCAATRFVMITYLVFTQLKGVHCRVTVACCKPYCCLLAISDSASNVDSVRLTNVCIYIIIIRSTSKSRPNNIRGGKNVRPYVRPSVRPQKSFFDFNEIWYVGRGRWVMHDGMPYGRIQGQGLGHEPFKVWIPSIFKTYLLCHLQWELASDH